ncbi:alpha-ribazole phosphatase [Leptospira sp. WS92.C1]
MELYLIRHTTPDVPKGMCYGKADIPLIAEFQSEFLGVLSKFKDFPSKIYSSPSLRCKKLSEFITQNNFINLEYSELLMELNFGYWEGKLWSEIPKKESEPWTQDFLNVRTPGGESYSDLAERISKFIKESVYPSSSSSLGIVTHAGVIRTFLCKLIGIPLERGFSFELDYGSVSKILIVKNETEFFSKLVYWNR